MAAVRTTGTSTLFSAERSFLPILLSSPSTGTYPALCIMAVGERQRRGVRSDMGQQEWTTGSGQRQEALRPLLPHAGTGTSFYFSSASRGCMTATPFLDNINQGFSGPEKHLN